MSHSRGGQHSLGNGHSTIGGHSTAGGHSTQLVDAILAANLLGSSLDQGVGIFQTPLIDDSTLGRFTSDFESIWRAMIAQEMPQEGQRRVENLIPFSQDMTQAGYSGILGATVTTPTTATYDGTTNGDIRNTLTIEDKGAGRNFIYSVKIRLVSGTISSNAAIQIGLIGGSFGFVTASIGDEVTSVAKRFTIGNITDASGTEALSRVLWSDAGVLEITDWQLEESTGRADLTTPSEYVPTGVGTGEELVTNGDFATDSDWTKGTGWTIGSGVASCDGSQAGNSDLAQSSVVSAGETVLVEFTVSGYSTGNPL